MPKFIRENLIKSTQRALDALAEFQHLEEHDLTRDEKLRIQTLNSFLASAHAGVQRLMQHLDERRAADLEGKPIPQPKTPDELFSWDTHEKEAKVKSAQIQLANLKKELEGME